MPSNHLILCCLLLPPSIFPSIRVFSRVSSSHQVAKVLDFQLQHPSFQWIFRTGWISLQHKRLSRVFLKRRHKLIVVQVGLGATGWKQGSFRERNLQSNHHSVRTCLHPWLNLALPCSSLIHFSCPWPSNRSWLRLREVKKGTKAQRKALKLVNPFDSDALALNKLFSFSFTVLILKETVQ